MSDVDWDAIFDLQHERPRGATPQELESFDAEVFGMLSIRELAEASIESVKDSERIYALRDSSPQLRLLALTSPAKSWALPQGRLPRSFLSLLHWSDGPIVGHDELFLQVMSSGGACGVREMMLAYHFPKYAPGLVPFAMDGMSNFAAFDMRSAPANGEYPIVVFHAGSLGVEEETVLVAKSFTEFCRSSRAVESYLFGGDDE